MKVAKQKNEYDKIINNLKESIPQKSLLTEKNEAQDYIAGAEEFYIQINHDTADNLHKAGFHDWDRIKFPMPKPFTESFMKNYEAYVQGYIMYFEKNDNLRGNEDRTIYFDWGKTNKEFDLVIYMKPLFVRNYDYNYPMSTFPSPPSTVDPPKLPKAPPPYGT
ncbi:MAG: hypothetical protein JST09_04510 [Bacteroidetes bacterium]|nr:hypothetical protein [Bacteroidota bacterium]